MRNWPQTVPGASFNGFPFEVEREGIPTSGRLVALHPYAKGGHSTEDTGRKARRYRVTAYLVGDDADAQADAFVEHCSTEGVGTLVLPITFPVEVRCIECATNSDKSRQGLVAIDLEFVEAGSDPGGFPAIPLGDRLAQGTLDTLSALVGDALDAIAIPF